MFGPDAASSLTIDEIAELVKGVRFIEKANAHPIDKNDTQPYGELKRIFEKSLAVNRDLPAGHTLTFADLEAKKPADRGISARLYRDVIGRQLAVAKTRYSFLNEEDLQA
jgi:N-acetylneuraminate synthase